MKIRVYISADPSTSQLFEDVDKVIDGVNDNSGVSNERNPKLVLLRRTGKKEDLVNGFRQKVGEQDKMETIAVFNLWTFWKLMPDAKKPESAPYEKNKEATERLKKLNDKDLSKLLDLLSDVGARDMSMD